MRNANKSWYYLVAKRDNLGYSESEENEGSCVVGTQKPIISDFINL